MVLKNGEFSRRTSITSSIRRLRSQINAATSTADLDLVDHDFVQQEVDGDVRDQDKSVQNNNNEVGPVPKTVPSCGSLQLERLFGTGHCFAITLGVLVSFGSLFSVRGIWLNVGGLVPSIFVWVTAGAMMFVGAQCYAELATSIRKSGGEFIFLHEAGLPSPMPAFVQVWMGVLMGSGASISVLGRMGGYHLLQLFCTCDDINNKSPIVNLVTAMLICFFIIIHCRSTLVAAWLQVALTTFKLLSFGFVLVPGFIHLVTGRTSNLRENAWYSTSTWEASPMAAFATASMSYSGWQSLSFMTEEIKKPEKNIPYVTSFSLLIAIVLCIALNVAYGTLLTPEELTSSQPIIMLIGYRVLGSRWRLVHLPIAVCALSDMNVVIFSVSRLFFSAGREGQAPSLWSMVHIKRGTFIPAILFMLPTALIILFMDIDALLGTVAPYQWLTSALVGITLLVYRVRCPDLPRPFKVPILFPVLYIAYCIFLTALAIGNDAKVLGIVLASLLPAIPLQIFIVKLKRPRCFLRLVGRVTLVLQKILLVVAPEKTQPDIQL